MHMHLFAVSYICCNVTKKFCITALTRQCYIVLAAHEFPALNLKCKVGGKSGREIVGEM